MTVTTAATTTTTTYTQYGGESQKQKMTQAMFGKDTHVFIGLLIYVTNKCCATSWILQSNVDLGIIVATR